MAVNVLSTVVPWGHTRRLANAINCRLTALAVRRLTRTLPKPVVLWIYDPCAAPMIGKCGQQLAVHDLTAAAIG